MLDLILLVHFVLFHFFHCYNLASLAVSANPNLAKCASTYDRQRFEVFDCNLLPPKLTHSNLRSSIKFCFFVQYVLLNQFFLLFAETKMIHLLFEHFPSVFALILFANTSCVLALNVLLCKLSSFFHAFSYLRRGSLDDLLLVLGRDLGSSGRASEEVVRLNFELSHYLN